MSKGKLVGVGHIGRSHYDKTKKDLPIIEPDSDGIERGVLVVLKALPIITGSPSLSLIKDKIGEIKSSWPTKYGKQVEVKYSIEDIPDSFLFIVGSSMVFPANWLEFIPKKKRSII